MAEWGANPVAKVNLTPDEISNLIREIEKGAKSRQDNGALESSADFACGALSVFNALGIPCTVWPLQIMAGISWFEGENISTAYVSRRQLIEAMKRLLSLAEAMQERLNDLGEDVDFSEEEFQETKNLIGQVEK